MATYSISELEEISGIKAHTIRTWEKRYGVITPDRTSSNVRTYSESDLQHLLNIAYLNGQGLRISKIASMSQGEIAAQADQLRTENTEAHNMIGALSMALIEFAPNKLECLVQSQIRHLGVERAMLEVIFPFLERMSLLLMSGSISPVHEQLFAEILKQKLLSAIDQTPRVPSSGPSLLLLSTGQGLMDIRRLFLHYCARVRGIQVINLGARLTSEDVHSAINGCRPDYCLALHDMSADNAILSALIEPTANSSPFQLLIYGRDLHIAASSTPPDTLFLNGVDEALDFFDDIMPESALQGII